MKKRPSKIISSCEHHFVLCISLLTITSGTTNDHFLQKVNLKESEAVKFWVNFSGSCVSTPFPISKFVSFVGYFSSIFFPSSPPSFFLLFFLPWELFLSDVTKPKFVEKAIKPLNKKLPLASLHCMMTTREIKHKIISFGLAGGYGPIKVFWVG